MSLNNVIAERKLLFSNKDDKQNKKSFVIQIYAPYIIRNSDVNFNVGTEGLYYCKVDMIGIDESCFDSYGTDSLQALVFVAKGMECFINRLLKKYDLYYENGEPYCRSYL